MCKTVSVGAGQEHPDPPRASPDGLESRLAVAFRSGATSSAEPVEACVRTRGPGGQGAGRVQVQAQGGDPPQSRLGSPASVRTGRDVSTRHFQFLSPKRAEDVGVDRSSWKRGRAHHLPLSSLDLKLGINSRGPKATALVTSHRT